MLVTKIRKRCDINASAPRSNLRDPQPQSVLSERSLESAALLVSHLLPRVIRPFFPLPCITEMSCPSDNTQAVDQSHFWGSGSIHWDAHRVGWAVAGGCSLLVRATFSQDNVGSSHLPDCRLL
jgi:hypothetical protein